MNSREGGTKMIEITEAPTIKKEKKSKKKKADKEAVSTDSDSETKQRRESQSSIGSTGDLSILTSPKPAGRRRNSSVSSKETESGKKRRNSSAYDSSDSAASTSPYRGKKMSSQNTGHYGQLEEPQPYSYSSEANYSLHSEPISQPTPHFTPNVPPPTHTQQIQQQQQMFSPVKTEQADQPAQMQLTNEQINLAQELFQ